MNLPDTQNVFEVIYRYKLPKSGIVREFYLDGEGLKKFFEQIGGASVFFTIHGGSFKPLPWKIRRK